MKSGGFGIGKKQARTEAPKRVAPPSNADMTALLAASQKALDKLFSFSWQPTGKNISYTLTVINYGAQKDRRGWSNNAIENSGIGEGEWKLLQEFEGKSTEIFAMQSSDALLILTLMDEALGMQTAPLPDMAPPDKGGGDSSNSSVAQTPSQNVFESAVPAAPAARATTENSSPPAPSKKSAPYEEGNLRQTNVRTIAEAFATAKTTGRLCCETNTVQAEVFFTNGEPVHGKSCHAFYEGKEVLGDAVLVDLLTWREGSYKFQNGWFAASRTINKPLQMFLDGEVVIEPEAPAPVEAAAPPPPPPPPPPAAAPAPAVAPQAVAAPPAYPRVAKPDTADDFSNVDELIGETYVTLVESYGLIKYGLFLMLARSEFVRFESGKIPFCVASISLEIPGGRMTDETLKNIAECFEPACQPLDLLACASPTKLVALFPQCNSATAATTMKHFINNVLSTALDGTVHGSALRVGVGLAEVPKDGADFQQVFEHACKLRTEATPERRVVTSP